MIIWEKLQEDEFYTETELAIIAYLNQHRHQLEKMTIGHLAGETFSSNASIIRLCHKLSFQGFRDFRLALLTELEAEKFLDKSVDYSRPFELGESTDQIAKSLFSLYKKSMDQVQSLLDLSQLEAMAELMSQGERVFLFGYGDVKLTLKSFINKLAKIDFFPILATDNDEEHVIVNHIRKGDVALFVSYSGTNEKMLDKLSQLRRRGVPILVITANEHSPLLAHSQAQLIIPDLEKDNKIATFYSQLSFDYLLNLIYTLIYKRRAERDEL